MVLPGRPARFGLLVLALASLVLVPFAFWGETIEAWTARQDWREIGPLAAAALGIALLSLDILLPVPSSLVGMALGAALGPVAGTVVGAIGLTLGCALGYALGRSIGSAVIGRVIRADELAQVQDWLDRRGTMALALLRPIPVLAETSVVAAGLACMAPGRALFATGVANLGISAIYAGIGATVPGVSAFVLALIAALLLPAAALSGLSAFRRLISGP